MLWRNTDLSMCPGIRDARHQSFSASPQPSQTQHDWPKRFYGRKTDSSKSGRSHHYYLAKSTRSHHYHGRPTTISRLIIGMNDRQVCIANRYPQSIVRSRECCRKKLTLFMTFIFRRWSGKQLRPDIGPFHGIRFVSDRTFTGFFPS